MFSVPFNGNLDGLRNLLKAGAKKVYGCASQPLPEANLATSGRASIDLVDVTWVVLEQAVSLSYQHNAEFEYVLNTPNYAAIENDAAYRKTYKKLLGKIKEIGISTIKISAPVLIPLIDSYSFDFSVSKFSRVRSPQQAKHWEQLGVKCICLDPSINREFKIIQAIKKTVSCQIELLVNDFCLSGCPFALSHASYSCAYSGVGNIYQYNHYYSFHCIQEFVNRPENIIKAPFIRPEDLHLYEELGINWFKLTDRNMSSEWLSNVMSAYTDRLYEGNIIDLFSLLSCWNHKHNYDQDTLDKLHHSFYTRDESAFHIFRKLLPALLQVFVDNTKLDGFISHFLKTSCSELACSQECTYCHNIAHQRVIMNGTLHKRSIELLKDVINIQHNL